MRTREERQKLIDRAKGPKPSYRSEEEHESYLASVDLMGEVLNIFADIAGTLKKIEANQRR